MKENKPKMKKELREAMLGNLVQLGTLVLFGFVCGFLLMRTAKKNDDSNGWLYFTFSVILFSSIGIIIYLVKLLKKIKAIKKRKKLHE